MSTLQPAVLWFEDVGANDVEVAGGKGANLGVLTAAGIPVPPGFILTTHAYRTFLAGAGIERELSAVFAGLDVSDTPALERAAQSARDLIMSAAMSTSCADAIADAYARLGGGLVAVRSSATAEDTDEASFAGQQTTHLNVEGVPRVLEAVRSCWSSLFEPRAIHYRARCGIDQLSVTIAVPVQRMVQSERSGVAFCCDPVTHDHNVIVIEAVRGLGEALVCGAITPDMYVVDKPTLTVLDRTIVEQRAEMVHGQSESLDQVVWRDLPVVKRTRPKLNDEEIARLAATVKRVEQHYGAPQDIEWAEHAGEFYVLQARPVTTLQHTH